MRICVYVSVCGMLCICTSVQMGGGVKSLRPSGQGRDSHNTALGLTQVGTGGLGGSKVTAPCYTGLSRGPQERPEDNGTAGSWCGQPGHPGNSPPAPAGPGGEALSQPPAQHPVSLTNTG